MFHFILLFTLYNHKRLSIKSHIMNLSFQSELFLKYRFPLYLHCSKAQNNPVFLLMVDTSEFSTRKCPWAVHSTTDKHSEFILNAAKRLLIHVLIVQVFEDLLTGCSNANQHWSQIKRPCGWDDKYSYITTEKKTQRKWDNSDDIITNPWRMIEVWYTCL